MMSKVNVFLRKFGIFMVSAFVLAVSAFASEPTPIPTPDYDYSAITGGMATGMNTMATNLVTSVTPIIMAGLAIFGLLVTIRIGKAVFNRMLGRT